MKDIPRNGLNILVTRFQEIGDMLVFIPAVRALRQSLPHARITLLAKHAGGVEIMKKCPYIDDMIVVQGRSLKEKFRLIREFRKRKIDYFIISPQDLGRVPWALMGGAKKIVGYKKVYRYSEWQREKLISFIDIAPKYNTKATEVENCILLMEKALQDMGVEHNGQHLKELEYSWIDEEAVATATKILADLGLKQGHYAVSAPYSKRPAKNWPEDRFVDLFKRIHEKWDIPLLLLGGKLERSLTDRLQKELGAWCHVLAGETSLAESTKIIEDAFFMVGPDSGPAFIATAVGTPVVAFYGPADFNRWVPPVSRASRVNIFHKRDCNPCSHQVCPMSPSCIEEVTLDEVWEAVQRSVK